MAKSKRTIDPAKCPAGNTIIGHYNDDGTCMCPRLYVWRSFESVLPEVEEVLLIQAAVVAASRQEAKEKVLESARRHRQYQKFEKILKLNDPEIYDQSEVVFG
jgi:hypothetical protein